MRPATLAASLQASGRPAASSLAALGRTAVVSLSLGAARILITGCGGLTPPLSVSTPSAAISLHGSVHGGQQPVSGSSIQLYAVGTTGDGSTPTALLAPVVVTNLAGGFNITGLYTCPSASSLMYIVATGGNPGLGVGTNNTAIVLMAVLGQCGGLTSSTSISIDEVTTVAAAAALAPFTTPPFAIGSAGSDAAALANAFATALTFADTRGGTSPGIGQSGSTYSVPTAEINTLANILATCVNTSSSTSSACTSLFSLTGSPSDVLSAAVNLEKSPSSYNTNSIYALAAGTGPFQPQLTSPPTTFAITNTTSTSSITTSPANVTIGSTVVFSSNVGGIFVPPLSINFGGAFASGSFTSTKITCTVPSGTPFGTVNGTIQTASGTYPFIVNVYSPSGTTQVTLSPGAIPFPNQTVATQGAYVPVTVTNNGPTDVTVGSAVASGGSGSSFRINATACTSTTLGSGGACTVYVAFAPTAVGPQSSTMQVYVNGAAIAATVALSGTGN